MILNTHFRFGPNALLTHLINRQGIPYGPEVFLDEELSGRTRIGVHRGLSFVCYQSSISNGFEFVQESAYRVSVCARRR